MKIRLIIGFWFLLMLGTAAVLYAQTPDEKQPAPSPLSSEENDVKEKLAKLQQEVEGLKKKPKDFWDQAQIVGALLIPLSIGLTGFIISNALKQAEIKSSEKIAEANAISAQQIAEREREIALINATVSQAELIHSFLIPLTGENPHQRKLAIQALLLAIPKDGQRLVQILSESDPDQSVKTFANKKLSELSQSELIPQIFNSDEETSNKAAEIFLSLKQTETFILLELMEAAVNNYDNKQGVLNALRIIDKYAPNGNAIILHAFETLSEFLDTEDEDVKTALEKISNSFPKK